MYLEFFGFQQAPFNITPDSRFLYLSERHREALGSLLYGIEQRKGFIALTGEIGCGKTTVCRAMLGKLDREKVKVALILNPEIDDLELLQTINAEFGIPADSSSKRELQNQLNQFLLNEYQGDRNVVLLIDEAQRLSPDALEQVRLISNLETEDAKLIQIALVGQPELGDILDLAELEQLNQRITVRYHIRPLSFEELSDYIHHRLKVAEGKVPVHFQKKALKKIFDYSRGIPRRVNVVCDRSLLVAYVREENEITEETVAKAIEELGGMPKRHGESSKVMPTQWADKLAKDQPAGSGEQPTAAPPPPAVSSTNSSPGSFDNWLLAAMLMSLMGIVSYLLYQQSETRAGSSALALTPTSQTAPPASTELARTPSPTATPPPTPTPPPTATPQALVMAEELTPTPTPSPTPSPSPTPEPTSTPSPSPTPEPTPEKTPTPSPTPELTPSPTPTPTPTETPEPTPEKTPTPTPSPTPSPTPTPTPTPSPTSTPTPTPEVTPTPSPTATPEAVEAAKESKAVKQESLISAFAEQQESDQKEKFSSEKTPSWRYDKNGVLRVLTPEVTFPAALLTWLESAADRRLDQGDLEQLRGMSAQEIASLRMTAGRAPLFLRQARLPSNLELLSEGHLPVLTQFDDEAEGFGPWVVLIGLGPDSVTIKDPRNGTMNLPRDLVEEHLAAVIAPFFDKEGIVGLQPQDTNEAVVALQQKLAKVGLYKIEPSGTYDAFTEAVVKKFRQQEGIPGSSTIDSLVAFYLLRQTEDSGP